MVMCTALVFTLSLSAATVSVLRKFTPRNIRMMVETLIIAFYVIIVDVILKAYWPQMSGNLGPYVGLIITNCIVMGRCEAYGNTQPIGRAFLDGFFNALGYSFVLLIIAIFRELLGMGSLLGYQLEYYPLPEAGQGDHKKPDRDELQELAVELSWKIGQIARLGTAIVENQKVKADLSLLRLHATEEYF